MIKSKYHIEDHKVIKGCVSNKRKYQKFVYETLYSKMFYVVLRYMENEQDAKDVLQDAFLKVFDKVSLFSFKGSFEGWIRRLVVFHCIDVLRKNKLQHEDYKEDIENMSDGDDMIIEKDFNYEQLMAAIRQLTPQYQLVFSMYALDDFTHREIAKELNISEGTSKSNYSKAKRNLKEILERLKKDE